MTRFPACILGTAVVPWTESFALDEALFRHEIACLLAAGHKYLYVFGTAGEGYAVTESLFDEIVHLFIDEMGRELSTPVQLWVNRIAKIDRKRKASTRRKLFENQHHAQDELVPQYVSSERSRVDGDG